MEAVSNEIRVGYTDPDINSVLASIGGSSRPVSRHFNQSEDFFLQLEGEYTVPHLPIHHDVRVPVPGRDYLSALRGVTEQIAALAPQVLEDLTYYFDPAEILRPCFFSLYRVEEALYLYLVRIDLVMRASDSVVVERGTNDRTAHYRSRRLFLDNVVIPLTDVSRGDGKVQSFRIRQTISQTWIGEQGRGYFVQGIWMDADLSKFFSRLFLPPNKKTYPYYPFLCRYKTVCQFVLRLAPEGRRAMVPLLHRALVFLVPFMDQIESEMKGGSFSEQMQIFRQLKEKIPASWYEPWNTLRVEAYLNDADMKEFRVED